MMAYHFPYYNYCDTVLYRTAYVTVVIHDTQNAEPYCIYMCNFLWNVHEAYLVLS